MNIEYIIEGGVKNNFITIIIDNKRQYNFENNKEALEFVLKECNLTLSEEEWKYYEEGSLLEPDILEGTIEGVNVKFDIISSEDRLRAIGEHSNDFNWYVLHWDMKTNKYLNDIVFTDFSSAIKQFKEAEFLNENDRIELIYSSEDEDEPNFIFCAISKADL